MTLPNNFLINKEMILMRKFVLLVVICLFIVQPTNSFALSHVVESSPYKLSTPAPNIITPFKDIIDWRFQNINGRLHKRLYNYSKQVWIGDWIPC